MIKNTSIILTVQLNLYPKAALFIPLLAKSTKDNRGSEKQHEVTSNNNNAF